MMSTLSVQEEEAVAQAAFAAPGIPGVAVIALPLGAAVTMQCLAVAANIASLPWFFFWFAQGSNPLKAPCQATQALSATTAAAAGSPSQASANALALVLAAWLGARRRIRT